MTDPTPTNEMTQGPQAGNRQSARGTLQDYIARKEKEVEGLSVLLEVIPWNTITKEQETSLWRILGRVFNG